MEKTTDNTQWEDENAGVNRQICKVGGEVVTCIELRCAEEEGGKRFKNNPTIK